jgi:hypothetical protein
MTTADIASEAGLRHELTLLINGVTRSFGYFDADELEFGSETGDDVDPHYGPVTFGGQQTGGDLSLSRPWDRKRDAPIYQELKPLRGRVLGTVIVHQLDDFGQPVSSTPLDTISVRLTGVTKPAGSAAGGSNAGKLTVALVAQA